MIDYSIVGIDLAKKNLYLAQMDETGKVINEFSVSREEFLPFLKKRFKKGQMFAMEACAGCHFTTQDLVSIDYKAMILKTKDVKAYAKSRQKNDKNDAIAICKAARDVELKKVQPKTKEQQAVSHTHKIRKRIIKERIQATNSLIAGLYEFGYKTCSGKSKFATICREEVEKAYKENYILELVYEEMLLDCQMVESLLSREKAIDNKIKKANKNNPIAQLLLTIPGIGDINANIFSNMQASNYEESKDFAASLGIVPKQNTTGGVIRLGGISKQGDRYARTMLVQAARSLLMSTYGKAKEITKLHKFAMKLRDKKHFNVAAVGIANKMARIIHSCIVNKQSYNDKKTKASNYIINNDSCNK